MKNLKENTLKALVVISLFCSAAIADPGDMGGGGFVDSTSTTSQKTINSLDGDMGGGGFAANVDGARSYVDSLVITVYEYLGWAR